MRGFEYVPITMLLLVIEQTVNIAYGKKKTKKKQTKKTTPYREEYTVDIRVLT